MCGLKVAQFLSINIGENIMDFEGWVEDTTEWLVDEEDIQVIPLHLLQGLLETHIIVPREPTTAMIVRGNSQQEWAQNMRLTYKAMIEEV